MLLSTVQEPLLIHEAIIRPLQSTFSGLLDLDLGEEEVQYVIEIAYEICMRFSRNGNLFSLFFTPSGKTTAVGRSIPTDFLLSPSTHDVCGRGGPQVP
jgi:hypothetical protein